ncbi:MAG TPA: peptide chain release factor N(5)-glutamine methyltransferase [Candidatus Latescibacteria bacterium]|nr:peptide chain release factor N(5)-glutamine methyltransferase [Candidatus Latescibacterota bacterium]
MERDKNWKLLEILNRTADYLKSKAFENPRLDAELLLCHTLGLRRLDLYLEYDRPISREELDRFRTVLQKRLKHTPIQYITQKAEFMSLPFVVNPSVAIPRPETEVLVETVIARLGRQKGPSVVADIGTGCGAIAIALAKQMDDVSVYATDISGEAIEVARRNAHINGVSDRITFLQGDLLTPLASAPKGLDAIVSNPPYIKHADINILPAEIKDYEPPSAFDGGPDGLFYHRGLIERSPEFLKAGGILALEVGDGQAGEVSKLMECGLVFKRIEKVKDLNGVERVVLGEKV